MGVILIVVVIIIIFLIIILFLVNLMMKRNNRKWAEELERVTKEWEEMENVRFDSSSNELNKLNQINLDEVEAVPFYDSKKTNSNSNKFDEVVSSIVEDDLTKEFEMENTLDENIQEEKVESIFEADSFENEQRTMEIERVALSLNVDTNKIIDVKQKIEKKIKEKNYDNIFTKLVMIAIAKKMNIKYINNSLNKSQINTLLTEALALKFFKDNNDKIAKSITNDEEIEKIINESEFSVSELLEMLNVSNLKVIAKKFDIPNIESMNKDKLVKELTIYFDKYSEMKMEFINNNITPPPSLIKKVKNEI